jgi:hypothetical protein
MYLFIGWYCEHVHKYKYYWNGLGTHCGPSLTGAAEETKQLADLYMEVYFKLSLLAYDIKDIVGKLKL